MLAKTGSERDMKRTRTIIVGLAAVATLAAGAASAQFPFKGYLGEAVVDTTFAVPPAPAPGSPVAEADRAIFRATRALEGTPRWDMAIADADEKKSVYAMRCALGVEITSLFQAPKLTKLMLRVAPDLTNAVDKPKLLYSRKRPYLVDEGKICVAADPRLDASFDYPSGHASWGWAMGLILAELVPERAPQILQRARVFGESRVVCGVHNASSVEAGRTNGAAVIAALHGVPEFRADMEAARAEMAELRAKAKPVEGCDAEAALLAVPAW